MTIHIGEILKMSPYSNYSEEKFYDEFTSVDLKLFIHGNLKRKEKDWLDFKSAPLLESREGKKFRKGLKEKIQGIANGGGGVIILGVNQFNLQDPFEGVQNSDSWSNFLSQTMNDLKLPLLFPIFIINQKPIIFLLIPRPKNLIIFQGKIRTRVGSTTPTIEDSNDLESIQKELRNNPSGYHIVSNIKNDILRFRDDGLFDDELALSVRLKVLSDIRKVDYDTVLIFSIILTKVHSIIEEQTKVRVLKHKKNIILLNRLLLVFIGYSTAFIIVTYSLLANALNLLESLFIIILPYISGFLIITWIYDRFFRSKDLFNYDKPKLYIPIDLDFPPLVDLIDIKDRIEKKNINSAINQVLFSNLNFMLLKMSTWETYETDNMKGRKLKPNIESIPFLFLKEFSQWLSSQNYCNTLKKPPTEEIVNVVRLLAFDPVKKKVKDYSANFELSKIHLREGVQYILMYYLFMLEKFEEEYLLVKPVILLTASDNYPKKLKVKMKKNSLNTEFFP